MRLLPTVRVAATEEEAAGAADVADDAAVVDMDRGWS